MPTIVLRLLGVAFGSRRARMATAMVAISIAVSVGGWLFVKQQRQIGADDLRDEIEEQNDQITDDADAAEISIRRCFDSGRLWDFAANRCAGDAD